MLLVAGIGLEVLSWAELRRVDEDAGDDLVGIPPRPGDQGDVTPVQGAHGRDQTDSFAPAAPLSRLGAQFGDGSNQGQCAHQGLRTGVGRLAGCTRRLNGVDVVWS